MKISSDTAPFAGSVDREWRIGIVYASFYKEECDRLVASAEEMLLSAGIPPDHIQKYPVFGSFEIPLIGAALAARKSVDALIGIGIIVQGETRHAALIADQAAEGIMRVQTEHHIPFAFEILAVDTMEQARERLDQGAQAAQSVLQSLALLRRIGS